MGINYSFDGFLTVSPDLTWKQIQQAREALKDGMREVDRRTWARNKDTSLYDPRDYWPLWFQIEECTVETDDGPLYKRWAEMLVPSLDNGSLAYEMSDQMRVFFKLFPEHTFRGTVIALREDATTAYKFRAEGHTGVQALGYAYIHWVGGEETTSVSSLA